MFWEKLDDRILINYHWKGNKESHLSDETGLSKQKKFISAKNIHVIVEIWTNEKDSITWYHK